MNEKSHHRASICAKLQGTQGSKFYGQENLGVLKQLGVPLLFAFPWSSCLHFWFSWDSLERPPRDLFLYIGDESNWKELLNRIIGELLQ